MTEPLFRIAELSVLFGGLAALNNLDLDIGRGEIIGLIGPNGAGKTTAFNAITGRIRPTTGKVTFQGTDITGWKAHRVARAGIARTFQNIRLYSDLTVRENVMVACHSWINYSFLEAVIGLGRFAGDEHRVLARAEELLEIMGLTQMRNEKASSLPYGSQRKLEIARALALDPVLLLLDEPVAGMNPIETQDFSRLLTKLHTDLNLTIGLIEHDMSFVMGVCHKIRVIDHGIPIAWGTPKEIQRDEKVIKAYLGTGEE
ncbi:MAG: ABC transporter ATP-binding protein [Desulfomonile tiedjei]|nr:ABC transporter ATP-binding protein [Desulfomonile tiedjei]